MILGVDGLVHDADIARTHGYLMTFSFLRAAGNSQIITGPRIWISQVHQSA
jgi:hypothetical protein